MGIIYDNEISVVASSANEEKRIWELLHDVCDPEIPVLSIIDLGIVRNVSVFPGEKGSSNIVVTITPTYSGCPAMDMIAMNIKLHLISNGYADIKIESVLSPAWTTEWMTLEGKEKLKTYGIAAPHTVNSEQLPVQCPHCNSANTNLISQFGSTACKALYQCADCKEPFDYFKCH